MGPGLGDYNNHFRQNQRCLAPRLCGARVCEITAGGVREDCGGRVGRPLGGHGVQKSTQRSKVVKQANVSMD